MARRALEDGAEGTVLLIESSSAIADRVTAALAHPQGPGMRVIRSSNVRDGVASLEAGVVDVVLLDASEPSDARRQLMVLRARAPELPVIVLSGLDTGESGLAGVSLDRVQAVPRECEPELLCRAVQHALAESRLLAELQQKERELAATQARLNAIIEKNADAILVVDPEGVVRFANPAAEQLFGRRRDSLVGESFGFPVMAGETTELDVVRDDLDSRWAEMRVVETEWAGDPALLATLRDITERKRAEENAQRLLRERVARAAAESSWWAWRRISTYRARILEKMKMRTNAQLTHYGIRNGLVD
jgi:PAS domain-containing protein